MSGMRELCSMHELCNIQELSDMHKLYNSHELRVMHELCNIKWAQFYTLIRSGYGLLPVHLAEQNYYAA